MYNAYFGFSESPFENNLDQRFLLLSKDHLEVLAALLYFVSARKSFAMVCGDVGTGKTMLVNCFVERLPETIQLVTISNPYVSSRDLLSYIAKTLNIEDSKSENILDLTNEIKDALIAFKEMHRQLIIIIDEAHLLADQALEEIRLLSNLETPEEKLLQILLLGQNELSYKLARPEMRHLRQRINVNRYLSPLNPQETVQYIDHRLKQVGSNFASVFEPKCQNLLFKLTGGVPRRINQLCDNALLISMAEGVRAINPRILKKANEAAHIDLLLTPQPIRSRAGRFNRLFSLRGLTAAITAILVLAIISFNAEFFGKKLHQFQHKNLGAFTPPSETKSRLTEPRARETSSLEEQGSTSAHEGQPSEPQAALTTPSRHQTAANHQNTASSEGWGPLVSDVRQEDGSISPRSQAPLSTAPEVPVDSTLLTVKGGESLMGLAAQYYPDNKKLGLEAIILANPQVANIDIIHPGQTLNLPAINFLKQTIRLKDGFFYTKWGNYNAAARTERASWLTEHKVRFQVLNPRDLAGGMVYRIFLGGYDTEDALEIVYHNLKEQLKLRNGD
jgi:type II secretory pathway predicted ATPase ExeA